LAQGSPVQGPRLVVEDLIRVYRTPYLEVISLRGVSLTLDQSESIAIMGPSGSGKTTLLNLVGGLDRPTAGRILLDGVDITKLEPEELVRYRREKVGFVFQSFNLIPTLKAVQNVELPMIATGCHKSERRRRASKLLEIVRLSDRASHRPTELSGGEQQRVAIAAALANDPPLILADEPTGELDTETGMEVLDLFSSLKTELGKSEIIVTHDMRVGRKVDRTLNIEDGRITGEYQPTDAASLNLADLTSENARLRAKLDRLAGLAARIPRNS